MINYIEKGYHMHKALEEAGMRIVDTESGWRAGRGVTATDDSINAFILAYNPVPAEKAQKIREIQAKCDDLMHDLYPDMVGSHELLHDLIKSAVATTGSNLEKAQSLVADCELHINTVNAMSDISEIQAYDVSNGWTQV
jgi:hypothetical protein